MQWFRSGTSSQSRADPITFGLCDQRGGPGSLGGRERGTGAPTQAPAALPQERNRVKQQEWSLGPRRGSPEGAGQEL